MVLRFLAPFSAAVLDLFALQGPPHPQKGCALFGLRLDMLRMAIEIT